VLKYRGKYKIGWDELRRRRFARQKELGLSPADTRLAQDQKTSLLGTRWMKKNKIITI